MHNRFKNESVNVVMLIGRLAGQVVPMPRHAVEANLTNGTVRMPDVVDQDVEPEVEEATSVKSTKKKIIRRGRR
jgi:hypothetical protein